MDPRGHLQAVEAIREIASRIASEMGLELVDVVFRGAGKRWLVRLDIDRAGPVGVGIDDCQRLSIAVGAALEEADLIEHGYTLEVSSPGIDRPIRTADDVRRNTGRRVIAETAVPVHGRRSFRGILLGQEGDNYRLRQEDGTEVRIPVHEILKSQQDPVF